MELSRLHQLAGITSSTQAISIQPLFEVQDLFESQEFLIEIYQEYDILFSELAMLFEAENLSHAQIDKLFREIEDFLNSDKADVSNRNFWGKSVDSIRSKLRELLNWKKGKNKAGFVKDYDKVMTGFEQRIDKMNLPTKVKPEAVRIFDTMKEYGNEHPIAQKALVQIGTALIATNNASQKVQSAVIPALVGQTRKLLTDESAITGLTELLFNEGSGNLAEHLAFIDAWNQNKTLAEFVKENSEIVKAIKKYPEKVAEASAKLMNENIVCTIFASHKGEAKWEAAAKRFSSKKNKLFIWKNGIYYAGDLHDLANSTFSQIAKKVEDQPDAETVPLKANIVEEIQLDENFIGDFFRNLKDKVKGWQAKKTDAKSGLTHIVTYDSISKAWLKAGKPQDLDGLEKFLVEYLTKAYGKAHYLAIRKMLDTFFDEIKASAKADDLDSELASAGESSKAEPNEESPKEKVTGTEKTKDPESEKADTTASETNDSSSTELSTAEKDLLSQLYLIFKNGKREAAHNLAMNPHKNQLVAKALAKIYSKHGIKLNENNLEQFINNMILEDYRKKAGLPLTEASALLKTIEIELKHF